MKTTRHRPVSRNLIPLLAASLLVLAGCDGATTDPVAEPKPAGTQTQTAEATPTPTPDAYAGLSHKRTGRLLISASERFDRSLAEIRAARGDYPSAARAVLVFENMRHHPVIDLAGFAYTDSRRGYTYCHRTLNDEGRQTIMVGSGHRDGSGSCGG